MRPFRTAAGVVVLTVAMGCSNQPSSGTGDASASVTSSADPSSGTTEPPSGRLSRAAAAERYLAIVEPYNIAYEGLEASINEGLPLETVRARAKATADANDAHIQELRATAWPADVQPHVDELIAESELAQPSWRQAAQATTPEALMDAVLAALEHDGNTAATTIRRLLDLGEYDEADYS
jgi:hypothetical protein